MKIFNVLINGKKIDLYLVKLIRRNKPSGRMHLIQKFLLEHYKNKFFFDKNELIKIDDYKMKNRKSEEKIEIELFYREIGNDDYISHIITWTEENFIKMIKNKKEIFIEL